MQIEVLRVQPQLDELCHLVNYPRINLLGTMINNRLQPVVPFCGNSCLLHIPPAIGSGYLEPFGEKEMSTLGLNLKEKVEAVRRRIVKDLEPARKEEGLLNLLNGSFEHDDKHNCTKKYIYMLQFANVSAHECNKHYKVDKSYGHVPFLKYTAPLGCVSLAHAKKHIVPLETLVNAQIKATNFFNDRTDEIKNILYRQSSNSNSLKSNFCVGMEEPTAPPLPLLNLVNRAGR